MRVSTVGFTKKSAEQFFSAISASGVKRVVDVRLSNASQLAGFSKRDDLQYFLREICGVAYVHRLDLAPTHELLNAYRNENGTWGAYERGFLELMRRRRVEETVSPETIGDGCLLCSEAAADHCHRRLVADYLRDRWGDLEIVHLA